MKILEKKNLRNDIFGGITAGIVALPLALAFGIQAFGVISVEEVGNIGAIGALAGLTGAMMIGFFASLFGTTIREGYDLVAPVYSQIEPFRHRKAGKLSGGMKQKLALSCALIHKPRVLFLDEPTTGVDVVSRIEFWDMLQSLRQQGITILVSTPYMDEAQRCGRVALINDGCLLDIDTPEQIVQRAGQTTFEEAFIHLMSLQQ